jgi:hypothetical protein
VLTRWPLAFVNSITKYPSIPTWHVMDKGRLTGTVACEADGPWELTEKIDGTNTRIVVDRDGDWLIGSREELLFAKGDRIGNPSMGIVDAVRALVEPLIPPSLGSGAAVVVWYGETYGGKIGPAKHYTRTAATGFRLFDRRSYDDALLDDLASRTPEQRAAWREEQPAGFGTPRTPTPGIDWAPVVAELDALPTDTAAAAALAGLERTRVGLDADGPAEGVVARLVRADGGRRLVKLRTEDYARALRSR